MRLPYLNRLFQFPLDDQRRVAACERRRGVARFDVRRQRRRTAGVGVGGGEKLRSLAGMIGAVTVLQSLHEPGVVVEGVDLVGIEADFYAVIARPDEFEQRAGFLDRRPRWRLLV